MQRQGTKLSLGKARGLQQCANEAGVFTIVAIDQRGLLRNMMSPEDPSGVPFEEVSSWKVEMTRHLGAVSSALLLDPTYAVGPAISQGALPNNLGLIATLETTAYDDADELDVISPNGFGDYRVNYIADEWGVEKSKLIGADAVKLLYFYNEPGTAAAEHQEALLEKTIAECEKYDIPLFLEPITYDIPNGPRKGTAEFAELKPKMVLDAARWICQSGVDVLKAEFPDDTDFVKDEALLAEHCQRLTEAANGVPWVLLSAGSPYETFKLQVRIASENGASGILGGRAIWQEAGGMDDRGRGEFVESTILPRVRELTDIVNENATPWTERYAPQLEQLDVARDWKYRY